MSSWNKDVLLAENEILIAKQNAIIEELRANQNQKAIKCLKDIKESFCSGKMIFLADCKLSYREKGLIVDYQEEDKRILADIIDDKIKELEKNND